MKNLSQHITESFEVNEAAEFKNKIDFDKFLIEIDGMGQAKIEDIMGDQYIDTPGNFKGEKRMYHNDIQEYMMANMGKSEFNELKKYWETHVQSKSS